MGKVRVEPALAARGAWDVLVVAAIAAWMLPRKPRASWMEIIPNMDIDYTDHSARLRFLPTGGSSWHNCDGVHACATRRRGQPRLALFEGVEEEAKRDDWIIHQHFFTAEGTRFVAVLGPESNHQGSRRQVVRIWDLTEDREGLLREFNWKGVVLSCGEWLAISDDRSTIAFPSDFYASDPSEAMPFSFTVVNVRDGVRHRLVPGLPPGALSRDGRFIAVLDADEDRKPIVAIQQVDGDRVAAISYAEIDVAESPHRMRLSDDHQQVALEFSAKVFVFDATTRRESAFLWIADDATSPKEYGLPWIGPGYELFPYHFPEANKDAEAPPVRLTMDTKWNGWNPRAATPELTRVLEYSGALRNWGIGHGPGSNPAAEAAEVIDLPSNKIVARFADSTLWSASISRDGRAVGLLDWQWRIPISMRSLMDSILAPLRGNSRRREYTWNARTIVRSVPDGTILGRVPFPDGADLRRVQSAIGPEGKTLVHRYLIHEDPLASFDSPVSAQIEVWDVPACGAARPRVLDRARRFAPDFSYRGVDRGEEEDSRFQGSRFNDIKERVMKRDRRQKKTRADSTVGKGADESRRPFWTTTRLSIAVISLLAIHWAMAVESLIQENPTVDEVAHLPTGVTYWQKGTFRLYPHNPPLVKLIASLPVVLAKPEMDKVYAGPNWPVRDSSGSGP